VLPTAVEYDLPVKWVILNDHGFVSIAGIQEAYFGGELGTYFTRADGTEYDIDFASMAEAFGVPAQRVSTPAELKAGIEEMLETDGPYLLDAQVSREGKGVDNGAQWVQAGRGTGPGETN
jgi:acetolactate synthase-1/2/3 large subunit